MALINYFYPKLHGEEFQSCAYSDEDVTTYHVLGNQPNKYCMAAVIHILKKFDYAFRLPTMADLKRPDIDKNDFIQAWAMREDGKIGVICGDNYAGVLHPVDKDAKLTIEIPEIPGVMFKLVLVRTDYKE